MGYCYQRNLRRWLFSTAMRDIYKGQVAIAGWFDSLLKIGNLRSLITADLPIRLAYAGYKSYLSHQRICVYAVDWSATDS